MTQNIKANYDFCSRCSFLHKAKEEKDNKFEMKCRCEYNKEEDSPIIGYLIKDLDGKEIFDHKNCEFIPNDCTYYLQQLFSSESFKNETVN